MDSCSLSFDVSRDMGRLLIGGLAGEEEELSYFDGVHLEYGMVDSRLILLRTRRPCPPTPGDWSFWISF